MSKGSKGKISIRAKCSWKSIYRYMHGIWYNNYMKKMPQNLQLMHLANTWALVPPKVASRPSLQNSWKPKWKKVGHDSVQYMVPECRKKLPHHPSTLQVSNKKGNLYNIYYSNNDIIIIIYDMYMSIQCKHVQVMRGVFSSNRGLPQASAVLLCDFSSAAIQKASASLPLN